MNTTQMTVSNPSERIVVCPEHAESAPDVHFTSSDGKILSAHQAVLAAATPVFAHMFSSIKSSADDTANNIQMAENAAVLQFGLRMAYVHYNVALPTSYKEIYSDDLFATYRFFDKMQMMVQKYLLYLHLLSPQGHILRDRMPTQMYAFACQEQLKELKDLTIEKAFPRDWRTSKEPWLMIGLDGSIDLLTRKLIETQETLAQTRHLLGRILSYNDNLAISTTHANESTHKAGRTLLLSNFVETCPNCEHGIEHGATVDELAACPDCSGGEWIVTGDTDPLESEY